MKRIDRLIFATNNAHKLEEARAILGSDIQLMSLADIGCHDDIPETSPTLKGNALQKARYIHDRYGVDCIADDTGLMVDALDGAPGVHSARYATDGHDSAANMKKLLAEMEGKENRQAHFSTVIAMVTDEGEHTFEGSVEGSITHEPSGENGFGYDPVFRADETGLTFANMNPEDKHAISHRGRALRAFRDWLKSLGIIILMLIPGLNASAEQWRQHPSYDGDILRVLDTPDFTYFVTLKQTYEPANRAGTVRYGSLLRYDKDNDEWKWLDKSTGLSENIVSDAIYDARRNILTIAYRNGNIDVFGKDGRKVNIPGLMLANSQVSKEVRSMAIDPETSEVWIATSNGYILIDPVKREVVTNRTFSDEINCVAFFDGKLFIGTPDGLYYGDKRASSISGMEKTGNIKNVNRLITLGDNRLYVRSNDGHPSRVTYLEKGNPQTLLPVGNDYTYSLEPGSGGLMLWDSNGLHWIDATSYTVTDYSKPSVVDNSSKHIAASADGRSVWFVQGRNGISRFDAPRDGKEWTVRMQDYYPNASRAFKCVEMACHPQYGMMVRGHGEEQGFNGIFLYLSDRLSALKDGDWTPLALNYISGIDPAGLDMYNPNGLAIDPKNTDHIYCGSMQHGLMRLDLAAPEKSIHLSRSNESGSDRPGFIDVVPPPAAWDKMCNFSTPRFDNDGNLWTIYYNPDKIDICQIWVWTPEDRLATTGRDNYRPMKKLDYDIEIKATSDVFPLVHSSNRNLLIVNSGWGSNSLFIIDTAGTPGDRGDDNVYAVTTFVDQDGTTFTPSVLEYFYEDPSSGTVWVGAHEGVFTFNPSEVVKGNTSVRRIKVARNDGTGLADYLLDGAYVSRIAVEPSGKKWFATIGAGIVVTSVDGKEVIRTFNASNSGLPHNNVHGIAFNPLNNSMMISTEEGLCEYFLPGNGGDSGSGDQARAYPNPVRPGYAGLVTIDMLPDNAAVKVTDAAGNMVKELGLASGDEITWDLTNLYNKRVPPGIYYILATNGPDDNAFAKVTKILIID